MRSKAKTLIILIPGFPADENDSTCVPFPQTFVRMLHKLHHEINVQVFAFQYPFRAAKYTWNGVQVRSFNGQNRGGFFRLMVWWKVWWAVKKVLRSRNAIGFLTFWAGECALLGTMLAKTSRCKSFTWLMGQDANKNNRFIRWMKPNPSSLIALSDFLRLEFFRHHGIEPAFTIIPGLDTSEFMPHRHARHVDVLGVGSLIPLKQYAQFITIVAGLKQRFPNIKAVICGDGPEKKRLLHIIAHLQLQGSITLVGELSHYEVLLLMQRSKILLHTSSYEGFGMVCMEALYAGAHVVSYCQPLKEVSAHHHIVRSQAQMQETAESLLAQPSLDHSPELIQPIEATVAAVVKLYSRPTIS